MSGTCKTVMTKDARPAIPAFVPPMWSDLIQACWQRKKEARPLFPRIIEQLQAIRQEGLPKLTVRLSPATGVRRVVSSVLVCGGAAGWGVCIVCARAAVSC